MKKKLTKKRNKKLLKGWKEFRIPSSEYSIVLNLMKAEVPPIIIKRSLEIFWKKLGERMGFIPDTVYSEGKDFRTFIAKKVKRVEDDNTNK